MLQLGEVDVSAAVLADRGVPLARLIGDHGANSVDDLDGRPPTDGWRVIHGDLVHPGEVLPIVAASWPIGGPDTWIVIRAYRADGQWQTAVEGTGVVARPGRAVRRAGLALEWVTEPATVARGTSPDLRLVLRNIGQQWWTADGNDDNYVEVWAVGQDGDDFPRAGADFGDMGAVVVDVLPSLEPGIAVAVTAAWRHPAGARNLPAGRYVLRARLLCLHLDAPPAALTVY
ncbi:hypothetical protein GCM10011594_43580 [Nakamurella endophytica]|uniref:Uncharacterized protein n=1 Tax=Nakamurella endophytica TaxID=1748367 RepID=A0A917TCT5_9ACTN|nr:hypothetical protein GCM10011594_43580 [Nakamurella endophytica]